MELRRKDQRMNQLDQIRLRINEFMANDIYRLIDFSPCFENLHNILKYTTHIDVHQLVYSDPD